ncbi:uncharacterized protein MYCFIDRAFT_174346 [Pseudocercospora fijiensis CIRAD86]|uniref:Uncharacterized protein n=1 Tax=Pseudocercospora fijiensis (strain CIRAD86) TaxID=383855 RepID=M2YYV3_PSEFD|nr:uncharacterized protein MYCFIDRAFT_174346 [Pseudocercospora fijiensis CIRAD86]EME82810.1 hypothetical protein MYCFIDRAFT_174346 [Pseudocercospora fijiensis CIRAD86]
MVLLEFQRLSRDRSADRGNSVINCNRMGGSYHDVTSTDLREWYIRFYSTQSMLDLVYMKVLRLTQSSGAGGFPLQIEFRNEEPAEHKQAAPSWTSARPVAAHVGAAQVPVTCLATRAGKNEIRPCTPAILAKLYGIASDRIAAPWTTLKKDEGSTVMRPSFEQYCFVPATVVGVHPLLWERMRNESGRVHFSLWSEVSRRNNTYGVAATQVSEHPEVESGRCYEQRADSSAAQTSSHTDRDASINEQRDSDIKHEALSLFSQTLVSASAPESNPLLPYLATDPSPVRAPVSPLGWKKRDLGRAVLWGFVRSEGLRSDQAAFAEPSSKLAKTQPQSTGYTPASDAALFDLGAKVRRHPAAKVRAKGTLTTTARDNRVFRSMPTTRSVIIDTSPLGAESSAEFGFKNLKLAMILQIMPAVFKMVKIQTCGSKMVSHELLGLESRAAHTYFVHLQRTQEVSASERRMTFSDSVRNRASIGVSGKNIQSTRPRAELSRPSRRQRAFSLLPYDKSAPTTIVAPIDTPYHHRVTNISYHKDESYSIPDFCRRVLELRYLFAEAGQEFRAWYATAARIHSRLLTRVFRRFCDTQMDSVWIMLRRGQEWWPVVGLFHGPKTPIDGSVMDMVSKQRRWWQVRVSRDHANPYSNASSKIKTS